MIFLITSGVHEMPPKQRVLVVGAGFAGLAASIELSKLGIPVTLCERHHHIGGLSRTIHLDGIDFELGPHIYFDKDREVTAFWHSLPGVQMMKYERRNRIFYDGKFIKSPLDIVDTLFNLGPIVVGRIMWSYIARIFHHIDVQSAEDWVRANFGEELFLRFFKVYNEKIWGIPSSEMSADWAGQRIKASLATMIVRSIFRDKNYIVKTFEFPVGGSRSIYEAQLNQLVNTLHHEFMYHEEPKVIRRCENGYSVDFLRRGTVEQYSHIIWTGHLDELLEILQDDEFGDIDSLKHNAFELKYRNLVLLNVVFDNQDLLNFQEHWIDIHDPSIRALRVTNFANYNQQRDSNVSGVGIEYNCWNTDDIWQYSDDQVLNLGITELQTMGLISSNTKPRSFSVVRIPRAYPVYFKGYRALIHSILESLQRRSNLIVTGRNGLYKWNNMHHSVKTGILAARIVIGEQHDLSTIKGMVSIGKDTD